MPTEKSPQEANSKEGKKDRAPAITSSPVTGELNLSRVSRPAGRTEGTN